MVRGQLIAAAMLLASAGPSAAQDAPQQIITDPTWSEIPAPDDMGDAYPAFASAIATSGWAQMQCRVTLEGRLALCEVEKTVPAGLGFDRAALSLVPRFRLNPRTVDGDIEKSSVRFSVRFRLGDDDPRPTWTGRQPTADELSRVRQTIGWMAEHMGPPPNELLGRLDVDADRREAVEAMIRQVDQEMLDQRLDGYALVMARTASPEQLDDLMNRRPPRGGPPSEDVLKAAGGDLRPVERQYGDRLRALYCARYPCLSADAPDPES